MQDVHSMRLDGLFAVAKFAGRRANQEIAANALAVYTGAGSVMGGKEGAANLSSFCSSMGFHFEDTAPQGGFSDDGDKIAAIGLQMGARLKGRK